VDSESFDNRDDSPQADEPRLEPPPSDAPRDDAEAEAARRLLLRAAQQAESGREHAQPPLQFGLWELFLITTAAALGSAGVRLWPPAVFAGLSGALALFFVVLMLTAGRDSRAINILAICACVMYVAAIAAELAIWH